MNKLWYKKPATNWNEALPLGNGRLGAMVYGGVENAMLSLNEDSLWYGKETDRHNKDAYANLDKLRELIKDEKYDQANELAILSMVATPETQRHYEPLGNLYLSFVYPDEVGNIDKGKHLSNVLSFNPSKGIDELPPDYLRELNLENAVHKVEYSINNITYTRSTFVSHMDNALVINIKASKPKSIFVWANINRESGRYLDYTGISDNNTLTINGGCGKDGIEFCAHIRTYTIGGTRKTMGQYMVIEAADEVTYCLNAATSFREKNINTACINALNKLENVEYETLLERHIMDYQSLNTRSSINIEDTNSLSSLPTDKRLESLKKGNNDPALIGLYYEFGKYLLISSSRQGSMAANLQGIWNDLLRPPWDSKYTININIEMNYWPSNIMNLSELETPFFELLEKMRVNGRKTAKQMYNCRGFMAHHNTDIWGDTAPQDACLTSTFWVLGGAWMSTHIFEHYLFTKDLDFLKEKFPTMLEAAQFLIDFMTIDEDGYMITSPSSSPENLFISPDGTIGSICKSASMDFQIIRMLFTQCVMAAKVLDEVDNKIVQDIIITLPKLPKIKLGMDGRILEWEKEYEEVNKGHRHMSHLFALYPDSHITPIKTKPLADAARKSLEFRLHHDGGATGWSRAWLINFWARLLDKKQVEYNVGMLLTKSSYTTLLDKHPPFQIDGNFGGASAIAEAILQSHSDEIYLLPALPKSWGRGKAKGLRARGGIGVDISFDEGELIYTNLYSQKDVKITVRLNNSKDIICENAQCENLGNGLYNVDLMANNVCKITKIQ